MATTENLHTGDASKTKFSFTFPYLKQTDVEVYLYTTDAWVKKTVTTDYTFDNATTIKFGSSPAAATSDEQTNLGNAKNIKIVRKTGSDSLSATFYPGSAIRSSDLNDNFTQNLYVTQESEGDASINKKTLESIVATTNDGGSTWVLAGNNTNASTDPKGVGYAITTADAALPKAGGVMTGNIVFEGATDDAYETTVTVVDPTADRTITLPNVTGTVVTTGDSGTVTTQMIANGTILAADIAADQIDSQHYAAASIDNEHLANNAVDTEEIANDAITNSKIADESIDSEHYVDESIDTAHYANQSVTKAKFNDALIVTASEQAAATADDDTFFTTSASDARYFKQDTGGTGETYDSSATWSGNDTHIATTKAIDNRVVDLIDEVGGFIAIASEAALPAEHPEKENVTADDRVGTILSLVTLTATYTPSGGTCTIPANTLTNHSNDATITDCGSQELTSGFGLLIETTAQTDAQYTAGPQYKFHRLVPKAAQVDIVASNISDVNDVADINTEIGVVAGKATEITTCHSKATEITTCHQKATEITTCHTNISSINDYAETYQVAASANSPTSDPDKRGDGTSTLQEGDLWFDTTAKLLKVRNTTSNEWETAVASPNALIAKALLSGKGDLITATADDTPSILGAGTNGEVLIANSSESSGLEWGKINSDGITNGSIDRVHLAADIVDGTKIADDVIDSEHYAAGSIDNEHLADDAVDSDEIAAGAIDWAHMSVNSVDSDQYVDGSIDHVHLANDCIDGDNIQDDVINSEHYAAGSIDNEHLADDAVDSDEIAAGAIDLAHMSANSVDSDQYVDGSIDVEHLADDAVDADSLYVSNTAVNDYVLKYDSTVNGKLKWEALGEAVIADNAVTNAKMADDSVDSDEIVAGAVDHVHLAADIIDGDNIQNDVIDSEHYVAGSIDLEHMSANSVDSDQYVDGSIDTVHLADDAVDSDKLADAISNTSLTINGAVVGLGPNMATNNTVLGKEAAELLEATGERNVAIGEEALHGATDGGNNDDNVAIGYQAGKLKDDAERNISIGSYAGGSDYDSSSDDNIAIGYAALHESTYGSDNVAIGSYALWDQTSGYQNIAVGHEALKNAGATSESVAIGYQSMYTADQIANDSTEPADNTCVGWKSGYALTKNKDNTFIGHSAALLVASPIGTAVDDASYNVAVGSGAMASATVASDSVAIGFEALKSSAATHDSCVAVGYKALTACTGDGAVAIGREAGSTMEGGATKTTLVGYKCGAAISTGDDNTAVGYEALLSTSTGSRNVALGVNALKLGNTDDSVVIGCYAGANLTGHDCVHIGYSAGNGSTSAEQNVYIGYTSGYGNNQGENNVHIGAYAGKQQSASGESTNNNTSVGYGAMYYVGTGTDDNVAIGYFAGFDLHGGEENVFVGMNAGANNTSGDDNTFIGFEAGKDHGTGSNNTAIGANAEPSTTTITNEFTLGDSIATLRCAVTSITSTSDERDKTDIVDLPVGLDFVNTLKPVKFKWQTRKGDAAKDGKVRAGFTAQQLKSAQEDANADFLDLVYESNPDKLEATYSNLIPVLVQAVQDLSVQVNQLKEELKLCQTS